MSVNTLIPSSLPSAEGGRSSLYPIRKVSEIAEILVDAPGLEPGTR